MNCILKYFTCGVFKIDVLDVGLNNIKIVVVRHSYSGDEFYGLVDQKLDFRDEDCVVWRRRENTWDGLLYFENLSQSSLCFFTHCYYQHNTLKMFLIRVMKD